MATDMGYTGSASASYADCVSVLRSSLSFLDSSVKTLDNGVSDFPRLITVLKTARHYELIPQTTLQTAESSLRSELAPAITTLLDRADTYIDRLDRRTESLKARAELQQGRLENAASARQPKTANPPTTSSKSSSASIAAANPRARALKQRREALQYSVERLELEALQRERELRKRLDAT
ncbi:DASH complex subunit Spc19 [Xylaria sp. CBS 124048]|nr:DASH complex subunit Spc19 [Xylaria sp. CBS 124048]